MADFPDDLIGVILLRLPVKSLLRFRSVSKTWCALIDNKHFVKQHLNSSIKTNNSKQKLILHTYLSSFIIHSIGLHSLTDQPLELFHPIKSPAMVLGSCNGLLCIWYGLLSNLLVLWNPATRKHVKLPVADSLRSDNYEYESEYGFGYDSVSDDYKVVMVHQFEDGNDFSRETNVYSLRSNSWRTIEDITHYCLCGHGALVCGALHWIGEVISGSRSRLVYAFDLATEKYRVLTLPKYPTDGPRMRHTLSELGGCLSVVCDDDSMVIVFDVWVMKDYVAETWTKLFTLSTTKINRPFRPMIPLAYSEIGDEVLLMLTLDTFFWYNLEMRTIKFVDVRGISHCFQPVIFLESLVCLGEKSEHDERLSREKEGPKEDHEEEAI